MNKLESLMIEEELPNGTIKCWHQCNYDHEPKKGLGACWRCLEWNDGSLTLEVCRQEPIKVKYCPFCGFTAEALMEINP